MHLCVTMVTATSFWTLMNALHIHYQQCFTGKRPIIILIMNRETSCKGFWVPQHDITAHVQKASLYWAIRVNTTWFPNFSREACETGCRQLCRCLWEPLVSILCSPQLTLANRCLSYTPFGVGQFFFFPFFLNHLIVIRFGKPSDVCSASIHSNYLRCNKFPTTASDNASGLSSVCSKLSPLNSAALINQPSHRSYCEQTWLKLHITATHRVKITPVASGRRTDA